MTDRKPEQILSEMLDELGHALFHAATYHRLASSIHHSWVEQQEALKPHARFIDEIYRASFDALIIAATRLIDRKTAISFDKLGRNLVHYAKLDARWQDLGKKLCTACEPAEGTALARARTWRDKVVAHNDKGSRSPERYAECKVTVDELWNELQALEGLLSEAGIAIANRGEIVLEGTEEFATAARAAMAKLAS